MTTKDIATRYATEIHRVVVGQDETVRLSFIALLLRGHLLIEGVPGTAKTLLARTVARIIMQEGPAAAQLILEIR